MVSGYGAIPFKVTLVLVQKPVTMGLWLVGGPNDGIVWNSISNINSFPLVPPNPDFLGLTFTHTLQASQEGEYRLYLYKDQTERRFDVLLNRSLMTMRRS